MQKPLLNRDYFVHPLEGNKFVFLSEIEQLLVQGRIFSFLIPLLNGELTVDQITERLEGKAGPLDIFLALSSLKGKNLLDSKILDECAALPVPKDTDPPDVPKKFTSLEISLKKFGKASIDCLTTLCNDAGIRIIDNAPFTIAVTDDYLQPALSEWNRRMLCEKRSWTLVKTRGMNGWIGPLFAPFAGPCWECLAYRLEWNRALELAIAQQIKSKCLLLPSYENPSLDSKMFSILFAELEQYINGEPDLTNKVVVFQSRIGTVESHAIVRRPQCKACGENVTANTPGIAENVSKKFWAISDLPASWQLKPDETLRRYSKHISYLTGIVSDLHRLSEENVPLPIYFAGHARKTSVPNIQAILNDRYLMNCGSGKTDSAAQASALGEAIERYCGFFHDQGPRISTTYRKLMDCAIHPQTLLNFSDAQYACREQYNRTADFRYRIPERLREDAEIEWTAVWSLTRNEYRYIPTAYCYNGYPEIPFCFADSNGSAADSSFENAILNGFFELVERDAVAIWWYNKISRPSVDLTSFQEPFLRHLEQFYSSKKGEFWVLDLTTDLNIPAFAAIGRRFRGLRERLSFGFGAHLDARMALLHAVTEISRTDPYLLAEQEMPVNPLFSEWWKRINTKALSYLQPDPGRKEKRAEDYQDNSGRDLREKILFCCEVARKRDLEMLILDQTEPDIQMPVIKMFVPGLRHILPRFGPGRLFDVPFQLGWIDQPLQETDLNEVPFLL